jgi:hypothetical protein
VSIPNLENFNGDGCSASIYTDVSVTRSEQCMDKDRHWTVKELAKHTGILVNTALNFVREFKNAKDCFQVSATLLR